MNGVSPGIGLVGGKDAGGVTSLVRSGVRRTVKSAAALVDVASAIGTVVSARVALTNSRFAFGVPLKSARITAPFFFASVPCQAAVIQSNSGRWRRDEAVIEIGSYRTPERCFSRKWEPAAGAAVTTTPTM